LSTTSNEAAKLYDVAVSQVTLLRAGYEKFVSYFGSTFFVCFP